MPIELTDEELRWILDYQMNNGIDQEPGFRAGLAAGIERAARVCDEQALNQSIFTSEDGWIYDSLIKCSAAIRALLK